MLDLPIHGPIIAQPKSLKYCTKHAVRSQADVKFVKWLLHENKTELIISAFQLAYPKNFKPGCLMH